MLNVHAVFCVLLEYARGREWRGAIDRALLAAQRGYGRQGQGPGERAGRGC